MSNNTFIITKSSVCRCLLVMTTCSLRCKCVPQDSDEASLTATFNAVFSD